MGSMMPRPRFWIPGDCDQIVRETRLYDFTSMLMQFGVLRAKPH